MLDIRQIRDNYDAMRAALLTRHAAGQAYAQLASDLDRVVALDDQRRTLVQAAQEFEQQRNARSKEIGAKKRANEDTANLQRTVLELKQTLERHQADLGVVETELNDLVLRIPNVPDPRVPVGKSEADNVVVRTWGTPRSFDFPAKQHFELGEALDILDLGRAAKLAGARFSLLKGSGARLERALTDFMLDLHTRQHGYTEIAPPYLVSGDTMRGTGQLPKFEAELFRIQAEKPLYLIPTAEVPLTNMYAGETIDEKVLPLKLTAYTPCFRSEAGSYGKDTRGILRVHQFDKVELVNIATPAQSPSALEDMVRCAARVLELLDLPYRVVTLCTADMGFSAAKTYDIEVWLPGQNCYREISSCSNCTEFQARRMNTRFKPADGGKPQLVHTLNGSGIAVGRAWIALLENWQQADGSIVVPPALRPFMDGLSCIKTI